MVGRVLDAGVICFLTQWGCRAPGKELFFTYLQKGRLVMSNAGIALSRPPTGEIASYDKKLKV